MLALRKHTPDSMCDELRSLFVGFLTFLFVEGPYLIDGKFPCHIFFFGYTFCRLVDFSQKLNMIFLDFHNTQSYYKFTAELFKYGFFLKYKYK